MNSVPEAIPQPALQRRLVWGSVVLAAWLCSLALAASILVVGVSRASVTDSGFEFLEPHINAAIPAALAFLSAAVLAGFAPKRKGAVTAFLLLGTTGMAAWTTFMIARRIEYDRTPPCWGIHSRDPGSGEGCPDGMGKDFTREQLDEWYRKQKARNQSSQ